MTVFQRLFFRRRAGAPEVSGARLFEGMTAERALSRLGGVRAEVRALPPMLAQRLLDGCQEALAYGREMSTEELLTLRGQMRGLGEFIRQWEAWCAQADEATGPDDGGEGGEDA